MLAFIATVKDDEEMYISMRRDFSFASPLPRDSLTMTRIHRPSQVERTMTCFEIVVSDLESTRCAAKDLEITVDRPA